MDRDVGESGGWGSVADLLLVTESWEDRSCCSRSE